MDSLGSYPYGYLSTVGYDLVNFRLGGFNYCEFGDKSRWSFTELWLNIVGIYISEYLDIYDDN